MAEKAIRQAFDKDPAQFLEKVIKDYVAGGPDNHLTAFGGDPIFDEPLVGFADGDDPIFQQYKTIIGDFHLTPREALANHMRARGGKEYSPQNISVISWVLPFTSKNRASMRRETVVPSLRWNHARWQGQDMIEGLAKYVVAVLERLGHQAVAPELADFFEIKTPPVGWSSNWSLRHMAYAAGLGTFSLNDALITARGTAMRSSSVVTDLAIKPSTAARRSYHADCLFFRGQKCGRCIERCPAGAISEQGHDKNRCREYLRNGQPAKLKELGRDEGYIGRTPGCALCQTKVPCEGRIPVRA